MSASSGPPRAELCSVQRDGDVLRLSGEIDQLNVSTVGGRIVAEIEAGVTHLDLSAVSYCGAVGIRALLTGRDVCRERGGILRLTCSPEVLRVLHLCGLDGDDTLLMITAAGAEADGDGPGARR
ncbi:hypothetical protein GCM10010168_28200 [Actinoplanes ianthinogenes]|uniref:STAS domain-containing protein n=1 Tax=Actinoplanes ianthinogenes TaxID=122358 RepID=A0ABN6C3A6_9ACTN|nr:STAS domain-containing protein [Actinoplanes ianthinogenes]BCJ39961.1 hypothetical protein Aiant_06180 [Actinoplanes ianthinogenes]GGR09303.1 hypothetical protein GCM10010168_28200 [Actinoplanes ianthinogenes]